MRRATGLALLVMIAGVSAVEAKAQSECTAPVCHAAMRFLDAYAAGDEAAVMAALSGGPLHMYGSDVSELADDRAAVKKIFDADRRLWQHSASWGEVSHVSSVTKGDVSSLFFDRVFRAGGREVVVRFAMVWVKEGDAWRLAQSSNTVPTTGQSAEQLTRVNDKQ
ncbi:MAG TPA: nuclear transport factor 2 family protein [Edaphobacter sp.]